DMAVPGQGIGAGHQEERAIGDVAHVEGPGGGRVEQVAHEDFVADAKRQYEDQPAEAFADPGAEQVDEKQEASHFLSPERKRRTITRGWHLTMPPSSTTQGRNKPVQPSIFPKWCS